LSGEKSAGARHGSRAGTCIVLACLGPTLLGALYAHGVLAHAPEHDFCPRPGTGSEVPEPESIRSTNGLLQLDLSIYGYDAPDGSERYCYRASGGQVAPTLRVHPGDQVVLRLRNHLQRIAHADHGHQHLTERAGSSPVTGGSSACSSGVMSASSTNLHFHGLVLPPTCHQDEVLTTSIQPGEPPFEYRFQIPASQPPGLYWYHPHIHGFTSRQVGGGAAGALIVEGLERAIPQVRGLPERVLVIRDSTLLNPNAPASTSEPVVPPPFLDPDGDVGNNHTGYGKPARDLSVNFVPVPYPDYTPARITLRPGERQLWRVLNASAITYAHLALLYDKVPQNLGVVAIDGVPVNFGDSAAASVKTVDHVLLPPGSRAEFIVTGPVAGQKGLLISRWVDTGQDGENDPNRALVAVSASDSAPEPDSMLPTESVPLPRSTLAWVGTVSPARTRRLYFSERRSNPADPDSPTIFMLTVDGQPAIPFDPVSSLPSVVAHQGDVEDWVIENRSLELHAFHVHQLHFQLRDWYGYTVNEPFLRDTVNVPYFDNHMTSYPSVTVRMDFRDPSTVGTFPYHCHLLEHEDGGMMGTIRVEPAAGSASGDASPSAMTRVLPAAPTPHQTPQTSLQSTDRTSVRSEAAAETGPPAG
jgi:FtsP/CotA-like multicopper oxidase with cupredoxin domain